MSGCRDRQSEMLLAGQTETENTRTPEVTEAVDAEITKTAEVEKQTEPAVVFHLIYAGICDRSTGRSGSGKLSDAGGKYIYSRKPGKRYG